MSNVKLAIRVRPFTEKELKLEKDGVSVINVADEHTVTITNLKVNVSGAGDSRERVRRYFADYTFDSSCSPTDSRYASQEVIFATLGRQVLSTISRGQSACVLAYGQSATGKTHTMMGSPGQPGLIPRICKALADEHLFDITISFLEIYNERVHDLLTGEPSLPHNSLPRRKGNVRKDLRVREHPTKGPYVQNLRRITVKDAESLLAIVHEGTRRRQTAATKRNSSSSRSHALIELVTPRATLHLADLAGSEKAGWEGTGGRQKEGANINKSLVALSNVISALVSGGVSRSRFVPYRDSALTWLLKDCFTGGGSTFIIATISPSVSCYGESASTLRWASRARRLPDTRKPNTKSKVALQTQFDAIIAELARHYIQYKPETGELLYDEKHWHLYVNQNLNKGSNKQAKIGNIMNLRYFKNENLQSEPTASSMVSSSIEVINNMDKNAEISNEINKEIDKLFGPALERTRSGIDIETETPLKYKKRHSRSQETLTNNIRLRDVHRLSDVAVNESETEKYIDDIKTSPQVSLLHNSQRAEIIASVTERLYTKLKNASKAESFQEKKAPSELKIMQPLNELKICSNARQRLMELSKKALRNKRKIGIPAHTQTRKTVIRVKDQAIDVQTDLQPYMSEQKYAYRFQQDVGTETVPMTPRLKEVAAGPKYSNLSFADKSTLTEAKKTSYKNIYTMTDIVITSNHSTQTHVVPPPRRKKRLSNYAKNIKEVENSKSSTDESTQSVSPIININITPICAIDSDSHSSDEIDLPQDKSRLSVSTTPDLLTNHNNLSKKKSESEINCNKINLDNCNDLNKNISTSIENLDDFSDLDLPLPRVTVDGTRKVGRKDYEDLIFGRNEQLYPYNIKISPFKERNKTKKVIRFKDTDIISDDFTDTKSDDFIFKERKSKRLHKNSVKKYASSDDSDSLDSNTDSDFIWKENTTKIQAGYQKKVQECSKCEEEDFRIRDKPTYFSSNCEEIAYNLENSKIKEKIYDFDTIEKHITRACHSLEASVNCYDSYLLSQKKRNCNSDTRTPTEYLQHLIKLRREAVKLEYQE